jgi:small-conductance mechanosensitive channel
MNEFWDKLLSWANLHVLNPSTASQLLWIVGALALGYVITRRPIRFLEQWFADAPVGPWVRPAAHAICDALLPGAMLLLLWFYAPLSDYLSQGSHKITDAAISLTLAWIVIRLFSSFIANPRLARLVAGSAWTVAALNITGLLTHLLAGMDALAIGIGDTRVSLLNMLSGLAVVALLLVAATLLARLLERQISGISSLSPSWRVLLSKLVRIALFTFALLVGLNTVGVDLTALTVFGGAVGVGLGFGLQKVISNFISGIILLADRSIKPGDVIVVGDTFGWVKHLSTRYVSLITRDGKEHLIPNEQLITERVENWSYSDNNVRLRIPVGISYDADPRQALQLMKDAAAECPRILTTPPVNALVIGFGDSAVDLELRMWIQDPAEGVGNVKSDVMLRIWDKFKEHGIGIPYPQRDVHIKGINPTAPLPPQEV